MRRWKRPKMAQVIFTKGPNGVEHRVVNDSYTPQAGEHALPFSGFVTDEMPGKWAARRVWDDATGAPRLPNPSEELQGARTEQEARVREAANAEHASQVRRFEAEVVAAIYGRLGLPGLNAEEQTIFNNMTARRTKLINLVTQIRGAATVEAARQITW